ncbi:TonB-dependent receptor [Snuella sedimenti]|uniref:TonB-dependent receptor n=1 Tax=Snuella sedimenti TaxID=2798802 RepID=A0A8J7IGI0_9FLAO|nr:TonB-dependent receptor [Snuella sedimenti]MBJ6367623.1 TonB-dependent receptor [Snuella sedimenti]
MKSILNILLCLSIAGIQAQNTLKGNVVETTTKKGLAFVNVYIPDLEKGTYTDEDGSFNLDRLPSGNYTLIVSALGYETLSLKATIPTNTSLTISLMPSAIEIEGIIISTPFHKLQSENVMKVEQESVRDLKSNGAITLAEGISNIAGVESISTGLSIGKPVIRGLSSNRVLVYTQGIRLENQQFGGEHGLGVNDAGIESVEVIKGPASLLYGSDALGGVLYLNPERFAQQNTSSADINANYTSNTKGYSTNVGYKQSNDRFKFLFRGSLTEHSDYKTKSYRVTNTRFREQDFKAGLGYQSQGVKTEFRYNVNNLKPGIPENIGEQSTRKSPLLPFQEVTNHVFSSKTKLFFDTSSLNINLGYVYNDRKEFEEHHHDEHEEHDEDHGHEEEHDEEHEEELHDDDILEAALHMKLKTINYDVKYNLPKLGKFETILGVQGMNQVNTNYGEETLIPNALTNDFGILGTSHIHFENLDVQLGARFDHRNIEINNSLNRNFNSFNGAIGFKTDIVKNVTGRVNLASGFRAPNLSELASDGTHEGANRYEIGNSNLKNEQNFQTDVSLEYKSQHLEFFVNGFYNAVNNYIFLAPSGTEIDNTPVYTYSQEDAKLYGGEFGFHLHPHPLDWLHVETSFETVTGKQTNGLFLPLIPANSLNNMVKVELNNEWLDKGYLFVNLKSVFKQNKVSNFEDATPSYNLLSAGLGGTFMCLKRELTITLAGNNLTNKTYISHLSRLKANGIFNMGRNINLGVSYNL